MEETTVIRDPKQIPVILDIIHDCWFEKDEIKFDPQRRVLSIRFKRAKKKRAQVAGKFLFLKRFQVPMVECFLKIYNVISHSVIDIARVGTYDFNTLKYDSNSNTITLETGVPLKIELKVERFEVLVEETDKVADFQTSMSIFR